MIEILFWFALAVLVYTFVGYPALVWLLGRLMPRAVQRGAIEPPVTVLIAAYNEAESIAGRIENCLELDYRPDRLEIVIASDGSTDGTVDVARRYERPAFPGPAVRVLAYPWRRGKPSVLNDTIPRCRGAIVVLGDARQRYETDAVRRRLEQGAALQSISVRTGSPVPPTGGWLPDDELTREWLQAVRQFRDDADEADRRRLSEGAAEGKTAS